MRMKQWSSIVLCIVLVFAQASVFAASTNLTALGKTSLIERIYLGAEQTGPFVERVAKLEKEVMGKESSESLLDKVDTLYTYTKISSPDAPSYLLRLNAAEWIFNHTVTSLPAKTRLEVLEKSLFGNSSPGPLDVRLGRVMRLSFPSGRIDVGQVSIQKETLVKIRTLSKIDSKKSRVGDMVAFKVIDDVFINGYLAIPRGTQGKGENHSSSAKSQLWSRCQSRDSL